MGTSAPSSLSQSGHAGWRANVARPTKGKSIRSGVLRLVLSVIIAISFLPPTVEAWLRSSDCLSGSADLVGDSFMLVGAADRWEGRHPAEKLCDVATRARRLGHRAGPAREHDEIEVDGAELVAE